MKESYSGNINSDDIRKGLLNLRNSQAQLLSQLKSQTQVKRKTVPQFQQSLINSAEKAKWQLIYPPLKTSIGDSYLQQSTKSFSNTMNLSTKSLAQEDLIQQNHYIKNENKLMSSNLQKCKNNYQSQKQKTKHLQIYLQLTGRLYYQLMDKFFQDQNSIIAMKQLLVENIKNNQAIYNKVNNNQLGKVLQLLESKQNMRLSLIQKKQHYNKLNSQVLELRSQLDKIIKATIVHTQEQFNTDKLVNTLKEDLSLKSKENEASAKKITKLELQNKQLKQQYEKQQNDKKCTTSEVQKLKKTSTTLQQKQKEIIFYAKQMENKKNKAEQQLAQKNNQSQQLKQNFEKIEILFNKIKEENQNLRKELQKVQAAKQKTINQQANFAKQRQNELRAIIEQQNTIIKKYEIQLSTLRNLLNEAKKSIQDQQKIQKPTEIIEKYVSQKTIKQQRIQILRTNNLIDHLWQVKEVQYQNINDLLESFDK